MGKLEYPNQKKCITDISNRFTLTYSGLFSISDPFGWIISSTCWSTGSSI